MSNPILSDQTPADAATVRAREFGYRAGSLCTVTFAGFDAEGRFLVRHSPDVAAVVAASVIGLDAHDVGAELVIGFDGGDSRYPIVLGRLTRHQALPSVPAPSTPSNKVEERLLLQAGRELELRCGDASIVLTRAGKVLIKGSYVLSRSKGANRIKGAFVDIN